MPRFRGQATAFGFPGTPATWTDARKQGVGSAYSYGSRIWFTIANGILTEVYYPTTDSPQIRDLEFLFADGRAVFLEEKRDFHHEVERIASTQGYRVVNSNGAGRLSLVKEIIAEPTRSCVLMRTELKGPNNLQTYLVCAPHLKGAGGDNNAYVIEDSGRELLAAEKNGTWLVLGASCRFSRLSCGYIGASDGYSDINASHGMTFAFDRAMHGDVALTAQLDVPGSRDFVVGLAFGETLESAAACLAQSLSREYGERRVAFLQQWEQVATVPKPLETAGEDSGRLYKASYTLLLGCEDKTYHGAFIASPTIPWGEARDDCAGQGGYHLVWTRDMVEVAMGLLAAGDTHTPLRALINLATRQEEDGSFAQNSWVNGRTFAKNMQLDEVAFPLMLAGRLRRDGLLQNFEPSLMIRRAANFLLLSGPVTGEERWEEMGGYSPSTLAAVIAAMICTSELLRGEGEATAAIVEEYADFLVVHLDEWTVTSAGSLHPEVHRYFIRLNPAKPGEVAAAGAVNQVELGLPDRAPGAPLTYPARDITDPGFLQLVRYGILAPDDPLIVDSLKVVDSTLMRETAGGKSWRRYNHDGYGQQPDGKPFGPWGQGGSWPLLTGERAHYEIAARGNYRDLIRAMEQFAEPNCLLPEQIWDEADRPEAGLYSGQATGSARPLLWAHAEYMRLLRSRHDDKVFDLIPAVADRYLKQKRECRVDYWLPKHPIPSARRERILRICAPEPFRLRWSGDNWATQQDGDSSSSAIGVEYLDLRPGIEFTFFWKQREQWEGRNYKVEQQ